MPARQVHREVFLAHNGPGPWPCYECGRDVYFETSFHVHHANGDDQDHSVMNLAAMHPPCHTSLTHRGKVSPQRGITLTEETRQKMGTGQKFRLAQLSPQERSRIAERGWETRRRKVA